MLSDTLRYINLAEVALGLVALRGRMHLCACVSKERLDGEGAGSQARSDTLRYINLAETPGYFEVCFLTLGTLIK